MSQITFPKDTVIEIMQELCDEYNKYNTAFSTNDKIHKKITLIAICALANLLQNQSDGEEPQDRLS